MWWLVLITILLLQWNARSFLSNGQDFKQFIYAQAEKLDLICIQETYLKPFLDFRVYWFVAVRCDREEGSGGGCLTLIKEGIPYKIGDREGVLEYVVIQVWMGGKVIMVVNFYNPCKKLALNKLEELDMKGNIIWCGDFNAHNLLWGSDKTDYNGGVLEEFLDSKNLVCLNDGRKTRIDVSSGKESVLDLTFASSSLAPLCEWRVNNKSFGSDHYLVVSKIRFGLIQVPEMLGGGSGCLGR